MKIKILALLLFVAIPISAVFGAWSVYRFNEIVQTSNKTTYSKEEEINLYDQMIEKANKNEITNSDLARIFKSQKKERIATHELMDSLQKAKYSAIKTMVFIVLFQMSLLYLYIRERDTNEKLT